MHMYKSVVKRNYIFSIVAFILCTRHILQLLGLSQIAALLFDALYIFTAIFACACLYRKVSKPLRVVDTLVFLGGGAVYLLLLFNIFVHYRFHLHDGLCFLLMIPVLLCADEVELSESDAKVFFNGITIVGVLLACLAFVPSSYKDGRLLLYTQNENQSGLLYMTVFLGVYVYQFLYRKHWSLWFVAVLLLFGCWQTQSRTSFMACIFLGALSFLFVKKTNLRKASFWISMCIFFALPFVILLLMQWLGEDFKIMGISAWTGRESLWPKAIDAIFERPFDFRIGTLIAGEYGNELGTHNVWLEIAWRYTVPVAAVFVLLLFRFGNGLFSIKNEKESAILIACFIAGLMHMSFEASIICGALDYSLYFVLPILAGKSINRK